VWRVVRTPEQIRQGMIADDGRGAGADFNHPGIDKDHKGVETRLSVATAAGRCCASVYCGVHTVHRSRSACGIVLDLHLLAPQCGINRTTHST
jgi:hypothetical protein